VAAVLKLLLFLSFFLSMVLAGRKAFTYFNNKIEESKSGWELFGFSLLLIAAYMILFFCGLYLLIKVYLFLVE
jgi:hypothetical protein